MWKTLKNPMVFGLEKQLEMVFTWPFKELLSGLKRGICSSRSTTNPGWWKREYLPCGAFKAARIGEVHWLYSPAHRFCRVPHPPGDLRMVIGDSFYRQRWKALETLFAARRCRGEGPVRVGVSVGVSELFLVDLPVFRDLPSRDLRWFKQPLNGRISDISLHHRISLDMIFHPWRIHFAHAGKDLRHPEIQFFSPLAVDQRLLEKIGIPWNSSYCQRLSMGPTNHSAWFSPL